MYTKPLRLYTLRLAAGFQTTLIYRLLYSHTDALPALGGRFQISRLAFFFFFFQLPKFISKYQESLLYSKERRVLIFRDVYI